MNITVKPYSGNFSYVQMYDKGTLYSSEIIKAGSMVGLFRMYFKAQFKKFRTATKKYLSGILNTSGTINGN